MTTNHWNKELIRKILEAHAEETISLNVAIKSRAALSYLSFNLNSFLHVLIESYTVYHLVAASFTKTHSTAPRQKAQVSRIQTRPLVICYPETFLGISEG